MLLMSKNDVYCDSNRMNGIHENTSLEKNISNLLSNAVKAVIIAVNQDLAQKCQLGTLPHA